MEGRGCAWAACVVAQKALCFTGIALLVAHVWWRTHLSAALGADWLLPPMPGSIMLLLLLLLVLVLLLLLCLLRLHGRCLRQVLQAFECMGSVGCKHLLLMFLPTLRTQVSTLPAASWLATITSASAVGVLLHGGGCVADALLSPAACK